MCVFGINTFWSIGFAKSCQSVLLAAAAHFLAPQNSGVKKKSLQISEIVKFVHPCTSTEHVKPRRAQSEHFSLESHSKFDDPSNLTGSTRVVTTNPLQNKGLECRPDARKPPTISHERHFLAKVGTSTSPSSSNH